MTSHGRIRGAGDSQKTREIIHSGNFMIISDFEAESRDDDDGVLIALPEEVHTEASVTISQAGDLAGIDDTGLRPSSSLRSSNTAVPSSHDSVLAMHRPSRSKGGDWQLPAPKFSSDETPNRAVMTIDQSLTKLFNCMTLAYSSKLTSPRWKNFKGLRLQWKDKIRLNNLIWRCWHMQFIERRNTALCQFASPLDCDQHNKPEAVVLEGKYWKRRLATVTAEYKKWRIFFKNRIMGRASKDLNDVNVSGELDNLDWSAGPRSNGSCNSGGGSLTLDDDFYMDFSDTLFSSLTSNQPFAFPNPREIAKGAGLADFIQPGLVQLQPNLDDFMDTLEPFHELLSDRLPPVEEEIVVGEEAQAVSQPPSHLTPSQLPSPLHAASLAAVPSGGLAAAAASVAHPLHHFQSMEVAPPQPDIAPDFFALQQQQQQQQQLHQQPPPHQHMHLQSSGLVYSYGNRPEASSSSAEPGFLSAAEQEQLLLTAGLSYDAVFHQSTDRQGFAVPTGKPRSRSKSGSTVMAAGGSSGSAVSGPSASLSGAVVDPCTSATRNTLRPRPSPSSPVHGAASSAAIGAGGAAGGSEGHRARIRSGPDRYPMMPLLPSGSGVAAPASKNRHILPDNGTLLAQLLGTGHAGPTTLLLAADPAAPRIPVLLPMSGENALAAEKTAVTLHSAPASFQFNAGGDVRRPLKRELSALKSAPALITNHEIDGSSIGASGSGVACGSARGSSAASGSAAASGSSTAANKAAPVATKPANERVHYKEHRRVCHINAEQKRRCNIKNGFDMLQSLLPGGASTGVGTSSSGASGSDGRSGSSAASGHGKASDVSKAAMLHRGADYIRQLRLERQQQQQEMEELKNTIESLNAAISGCQAMLPATGAPVSGHQRGQRLKELFDEWVRSRTLQTWKFWIFSILIKPLLDSFSTAVSASTYDDLWQNVLAWVDQHCSLTALRPVVMNSLRHLSKTTDILTDPSRLPDEAVRAACGAPADGPPSSSVI